jgi:hypothetical protein
MRKFFLAALLLSTLYGFSQKTLYGVALVQPKSGQAHAYETAWKSHLTKYYNGDSKRAVYEIITGDNAGMYQVIEGPFAYADMDKEMPNAKVRSQDFYSAVSPKLDMDKEGYTYRWIDTLSYNYKDVQATKYIQTNYNLKPGKMPDFLKEVRRAILINEQIKSPVSYTGYTMVFAGSKQQLVVRTALKEGFKQLETNFFPGNTEAFKTAYVKTYGQEAWDKRSTPGLYEYVDSFEQFLIKYRKDLSSTVINATAKK